MPDVGVGKKKGDGESGCQETDLGCKETLLYDGFSYTDYIKLPFMQYDFDKSCIDQASKSNE